MDTASFHVRMTASALGGLQGIDDYGTARDEPDRGER